MVMKACLGVIKKPTRFTIKGCIAIGESAKGNGIMIYAETQFIATKRAILVISAALLAGRVRDIFSPAFLKLTAPIIQKSDSPSQPIVCNQLTMSAASMNDAFTKAFL